MKLSKRDLLGIKITLIAICFSIYGYALGSGNYDFIYLASVMLLAVVHFLPSIDELVIDKDKIGQQ